LRSDIETIYVPVLENNTFRRGLEVELTQSLVEEINMRTHLRVVPREQADSELVGTIRDFKETVITKTAADRIIEKELTLFVRFRWVDLRTGRTIFRKNDVRATSDVVFAAGETVDAGRRRAFRAMARKIVRLMESDW